MERKSMHAIIEGRVQGVYFRDYTRQEAERLGLRGWVRNLRDGSVETVIAGAGDNVDQMVRWLHKGSPLSIVSKVTAVECPDDESLADFTIRY